MPESVMICIAYNPPENSNYCNRNIFDDLSENLLTTCNTNTPFLLIGDLNSRTGELLDFVDETENNDEQDGPPKREVIPTKRSNCDKNLTKWGTN